jgi:hypothetical protein
VPPAGVKVVVYAFSTTASRSVEGEILSGLPTVIVNGVVVVSTPDTSVAVTVNDVEPGVMGVPEIVPVEKNCNPVGKVWPSFHV